MAAAQHEGVKFEKTAERDHVAVLLRGQDAPVGLEEGSVQAEQACVWPVRWPDPQGGPVQSPSSQACLDHLSPVIAGGHKLLGHLVFGHC